MLPQWEMIVRLLLAAALGSVIGLERERLGWTAGLRTHMLVAVGSSLMILVSAYGFSATLGDHVVLTPRGSRPRSCPASASSAPGRSSCATRP